LNITVEGCVDSVASALAAERGGAGRLELCEQLDVGGVTPSAELIVAVKDVVRIPVFVMIRPRGGSFVHTPAEIDDMRKAIDTALRIGADGLVLGLLTTVGEIAIETTSELAARGDGAPVTFHRAFDEVRDQVVALELLIGSGVTRILTGGGPGRAIDNVNKLRRLVDQSRGRIAIMAGGKVRADNARALVEQAGVSELHARCELDPARIRSIVDALG
jgi:copper homeostasis protein